MTSQVEVRVELEGKDQRKYSTDPPRRISEYALSTSFTPPDYNEAELEIIGPVGKALIKEIGRLPGIKEMEIGKFHLKVRKKGVSFEEIEEQIFAAFRKALGQSES